MAAFQIWHGYVTLWDVALWEAHLKRRGYVSRSAMGVAGRVGSWRSRKRSKSDAVSFDLLASGEGGHAAV
jgi:hypothetical protein